MTSPASLATNPTSHFHFSLLFHTPPCLSHFLCQNKSFPPPLPSQTGCPKSPPGTAAVIWRNLEWGVWTVMGDRVCPSLGTQHWGLYCPSLSSLGIPQHHSLHYWPSPGWKTPQKIMFGGEMVNYRLCFDNHSPWRNFSGAWPSWDAAPPKSLGGIWIKEMQSESYRNLPRVC